MTVAISPLDDAGAPVAALTEQPDVTGEVCVRGEHVKDRYDKLWRTQRERAAAPAGIAPATSATSTPTGRLWIEGRLVHVITTERAR